MNVRELGAKIDEVIPVSLRCEWDNDGILCASDPDRSVKRVLCALDVTDDVVRYALNGNFDVIISHHPLIFKPLYALSADDAAQKMIIDLVRAGVAVMSYHTRLDAVSGGVADRLCSLAGVRDAETVPGGENILRVGNVEKTDLTTFSTNVKEALHCPLILTSDGGKEVCRVAVCPGDGKDFVSLSASIGADTYLTGRLSYNIMCDAKKYGMNLIEAGHFFTEDHITGYLAELISEISGAYTEVYSSLNIDIL